MPSNRLPRRILYGELLSGRRHPGGQKKRFSDNMKLILKCCHIPPEQFEALASDRQIWHDTFVSRLATFLAEYESVAENRCVRRHQPATVTFSGYRCPDCNRSGASAIAQDLVCTAIAVPTDNDYNVCRGASSSNIDGLPQVSKHRPADCLVDLGRSIVRDLGVHLDSDMSMHTHITQLAGVLRQLRSIRRSLPPSALTTLVTSFIISKVNYCNVALAGLPQYELDRVQSVVNAAAWLSGSLQMPTDTTM